MRPCGKAVIRPHAQEKRSIEKPLLEKAEMEQKRLRIRVQKFSVSASSAQPC